MYETVEIVPDFVDLILTEADWRERRQNHQKSIAKIVDPYLKRKQHHYKDPVLDFLFEYYAFRPSHLKKWSPGFGVFLEITTRGIVPDLSELSYTNRGCFLDPSCFPDKRKSSTRWILSLLENSLHKGPSFGCFGMHEWAMVYKADNVRHNQFPLRLSSKELTEFVESRPLVCTHFDAFRFFTNPAKPLNKFELSRENFNKTEQPGCLHTNMDLYKWAFKLFPWIGSDIIKQAFLLAVDTRILDMQASPYDLRSRGLESIKIETKAGRLEYVEQQKEIYQRSVPLRKQLIEEYQKLINHF